VTVQQLLFEPRFRGPPQSGNGGYVAGVLASYIAGPAEITLRAPVPLQRPLDLRPHGQGFTLQDGAALVAELRPAADFAFDPPSVPSWDDALRHAAHGGSGEESEFNRCFVCGRSRQPGDGLRVWAAHVPPRDGGPAMSLAAWQPHEAFARADGRIPPEYLWGALDCPGATAVLGEDDGRIVLTGRMAGVVEHLPRAGERCVVAGWALGAEGRKLYSGTAIFDATGRILARARITWIVVRGAA
jgi:hypothetical protein